MRIALSAKRLSVYILVQKGISPPIKLLENQICLLLFLVANK